MILETPTVEFITLDSTDIATVSNTGGVTTCDGDTGYMNNCGYYNIDGGYLSHYGTYDNYKKCSEYQYGDYDDNY